MIDRQRVELHVGSLARRDGANGMGVVVDRFDAGDLRGEFRVDLPVRAGFDRRHALAGHSCKREEKKGELHSPLIWKYPPGARRPDSWAAGTWCYCRPGIAACRIRIFGRSPPWREL